MLEFYYDYVDKFCNREDSQLMAMDRDSLYMALSADCLTDIIKPDMQSFLKKRNTNGFLARSPPRRPLLIDENPDYLKKNL